MKEGKGENRRVMGRYRRKRFSFQLSSAGLRAGTLGVIVLLSAFRKPARGAQKSMGTDSKSRASDEPGRAAIKAGGGTHLHGDAFSHR